MFARIGIFLPAVSEFTNECLLGDAQEREDRGRHGFQGRGPAAMTQLGAVADAMATDGNTANTENGGTS